VPNLNIDVNGAEIIVPGAYYFDNVTAALVTSAAIVPPLVWLAYSYGGEYTVPVTFNTAQDTLAFLRGAPCSDMVPFIFAPSGELNGASLVTVIPVGNNTPAVFTYTNSTATPVFEVTTLNNGLPSNLMQTSVVAGSVAGVEVTLFDGYANTTTYCDNLGVPFQIALATSATGVTFTVTQVGGLATTLVTTGAPSGQNLNIPIGSGGYTTTTELVEYINGTGFYSAQVLNSGPSYSHGNFPTQGFDPQGPFALAPIASGNVTYVNVNATLTEVQFWMETTASTYVVNPVLLQPSLHIHALAPTPLTHFTGGTNVPPLLADYANALNVALNVPAWVVIADQNIVGLPSLLAQHAETASSIPNRSWRRAVSGSNIGDPVSTVLGVAASLNATQATYCYPGIYRNNQTTGVNTLYGGYYVAAAVAGIMAGNPVMTPLTQKSLTGNGVEVQSSVTNINTLQEGGVMPLWVSPNTGVPVIVSDFTTWQNDANPENVFNQQVAGRQYLGYVMVAAMQPYIGQIESFISIGTQKKAAQTALNGQLITPTATSGVLNSWDPTSLVLNYTGAQQLTTITFNCVFVGQNRFITIEAFVQPLNLSA
jgi:hypothetical protein